MAENTNRRKVLTTLGLAPAAVISAVEMSKPVRGATAEGIHFGIDPKKATSTLRRLADQIEGGGALPQELKITSTLNVEDFLIHELGLTFALREQA